MMGGGKSGGSRGGGGMGFPFGGMESTAKIVNPNEIGVAFKWVNRGPMVIWTNIIRVTLSEASRGLIVSKDFPGENRVTGEGHLFVSIVFFAGSYLLMGKWMDYWYR